MMTKNLTLSTDTRNDLAKYALELLYDNLYDTIMTNLSKVQDNDRYHNWYHGYTEIRLFEMANIFTKVPLYQLNTNAKSGVISTQYFGEKFDADKIEAAMILQIKIQPPDNVRKNKNATLNFVVEKKSLAGITIGFDQLSTGDQSQWYQEAFETGIATRNYTALSERYIIFRREVTKEDVSRQNLILMPGFQLNWYYSGIEAIPEPKYFNKAFVRNSNSFHKNTFLMATLGLSNCYI